MNSLEGIKLVLNTATSACGGTEVYPRDSRINFKGVCFQPSVSNICSLEDIKLVPNLATRACGGTVFKGVVE